MGQKKITEAVFHDCRSRDDVIKVLCSSERDVLYSKIHTAVKKLSPERLGMLASGGNGAFAEGMSTDCGVILYRVLGERGLTSHVQEGAFLYFRGTNAHMSGLHMLETIAIASVIAMMADIIADRLGIMYCGF